MSDINDRDHVMATDSVGDRLALLLSLTAGLAQEDWAGLPAETQDDAIRALEQAEASHAAIRGAALAAFVDGPGLSWYGQQSATQYLVAETKVTLPAAKAHQAWAKRHARHPLIMDALGRQRITTSIAARICGWSDQLPSEYQAMADEILLNAWLGGCTEGVLAMLAREMREKLDTDNDGKPPAQGVTLDTTLDGASVLHGDLAPGVTALVKAAFEKYAVKQGADDHRTLAERQHDAVGEICRQVLSLHGQTQPGQTQPGQTEQAQAQAEAGAASTEGSAEREEDEEDDGLFAAPAQPAGASGASGGGANGKPLRPVTALVHIDLADLLDLSRASVLAREWVRRSAITWAGENARNATEPGYGGAWLSGDEARAYTEGASLTPIVTGRPDASVIPRLAAAGARLHALLNAERHGNAVDERARRGLAADLLGYAVKALSGPRGYASYLRTRLFAGTVLGSESLVLDVGRQRHIPRQTRIAVAVRDRKCSWPGCDRTATQSQPHHVQHYARGGHTTPENLKTCCWAHHNIVLHREGWNGTMHMDGTMDLYRPDGTQYLPGIRYEPEQRE